MRFFFDSVSDRAGRETVSRRRLLMRAVVVVAAAGLAARPATGVTFLQAPVRPQVAPDQDGRQVKLYDQLRVGLKATTKEDLEFITHVVALVDQGTLPRKLVDSTFLWARNHYRTHPGSHQLRPIVYFKPALIARAKKVGINV